jgi:hypothetical protein
MKWDDRVGRRQYHREGITSTLPPAMSGKSFAQPAEEAVAIRAALSAPEMASCHVPRTLWHRSRSGPLGIIVASHWRPAVLRRRSTLSASARHQLGSHRCASRTRSPPAATGATLRVGLRAARVSLGRPDDAGDPRRLGGCASPQRAGKRPDSRGCGSAGASVQRPVGTLVGRRWKHRRDCADRGGAVRRGPRLKLVRLSRNYGQSAVMQAGFERARACVVVPPVAWEVRR